MSDDANRVRIGIAKRIWFDVCADQRGETPQGKIHVGNITADCVRHAYYARTVPFSLHSLETILHFWHGRLLHSRPLLHGSKMEVELEWEGIIGHADEVADGILLEKKSSQSIPAHPYIFHARQAEYYKVLLEKAGHKINSVFIVYFLKDLSPQLPVPLKIEPRGSSLVADEMLQKKKIVMSAIANNYLPPPKYGADCKHCTYPSLCFGDKLSIEK